MMVMNTMIADCDDQLPQYSEHLRQCQTASYSPSNWPKLFPTAPFDDWTPVGHTPNYDYSDYSIYASSSSAATSAGSAYGAAAPQRSADFFEPPTFGVATTSQKNVSTIKYEEESTSGAFNGFYDNTNELISPSFLPESEKRDNVLPSSSSDRRSADYKSRQYGSRRRYKTPSPQLLRVRREAANARERRRMDHLNVAFEQLRGVLPEIDNGRRLSKFETLQMAQRYIDCLDQILGKNNKKQQL